MEQMFNALIEQKALVCLWQVSTNADGTVKRNIHNGIISGISKELETLQFQNDGGIDFGFAGEKVYVYSESYRASFKAILLECSGPHLSIGYPKELVVIPADNSDFTPPKSYLDKYGLMKGSGFTETFDEFLKVRGYKEPNEMIIGTGKTEKIQTLVVEQVQGPQINKSNTKMFLGMRESPRLAPKEDKYATVKRQDGSEVTLRVLDLSRGGAGLALLDENEIAKGEHIEIIAMEGKPLRKTLKGEVMAVRKTEDGGFKAGVKFVVDEAESEAA